MDERIRPVAATVTRDGDNPPDGWVLHELEDGETVHGTVLRLPARGAFNGSRLFLATPDGIFAIPATAAKGHTVLERELGKVRVGDRVKISYRGFRVTVDGERTYRDYRVEAAP